MDAIRSGYNTIVNPVVDTLGLAGTSAGLAAIMAFLAFMETECGKEWLAWFIAKFGLRVGLLTAIWSWFYFWVWPIIGPPLDKLNKGAKWVADTIADIAAAVKKWLEDHDFTGLSAMLGQFLDGILNQLGITGEMIRNALKWLIIAYVLRTLLRLRS
tara:strand:- start:1851 stop:2321 length:471 start_codon:yes stop_codon:yes gene_type:complete